MSLHPILEQALLEQALRPFAPHPLIRDGSHWVSDDPKAPTAAEIITMTEQSDMADQYCRWICENAGVPFPPQNKEKA